MRQGKKYQEALKKAKRLHEYQLAEGIDLIKSLSFAKFDETIEVACVLNIKKNQSIRDVFSFPNQFGNEVRVLVFAEGDAAEEAKEAGAQYVGSDELITKIKDGWFDFDVAVSTPELMRSVGKLGPVLGRRGLMPNPKTKTVTTEMAPTIAALKQGRAEFRADKTGVVHLGVGKLSMETAAITENAQYFIGELVKCKPADHKGEFVKGISVSSTMSPGVRLDVAALMGEGVK